MWKSKKEFTVEELEVSPFKTLGTLVLVGQYIYCAKDNKWATYLKEK